MRGQCACSVATRTLHCSTTAGKVAQSESPFFPYPDYSLTVNRAGQSEKYFDFALKRKDSWGVVRDWIQLERAAITQGYPSATTSVTLVGKLYDRMYEHLNTPIDSG